MLPAPLFYVAAPCRSCARCLLQVGYSVDTAIAAGTDNVELDLVVGGHSHTPLWGSPAPAGQPQLAGSPPSLTSTTKESATAEGPYPTNILNAAAAKSIPIVQAYWGSRYIGDLSTQWDGPGNLLTASGSMVLLGGNASANFVAGKPGSSQQGWAAMSCLSTGDGIVSATWLRVVQPGCLAFQMLMCCPQPMPTHACR